MSLFSFTKADRISKRFEFVRLSTSGEKIHTRQFLGIFSQSNAGRTRLGVTVTKKVGHAAIRNRIKRFCREFFRLNRHNITGEWDINIIAKKDAASITTEEAFLSLQNIFDRISRRFDH